MKNSKPPTDYRRTTNITLRNIVLGFAGVLILIGAIFIPYSYGLLGFAGGVTCIFISAVPIILTILAVLGIEKLSKWLDEKDD